MKNVLQYYYNLNTTNIHQVNGNYKCHIGNFEYIFCRFEKSPEELLEIQKLNIYLLSKGFLCHQIIFNINESPVTYVDGVQYVLMKVFVQNKFISVNNLVDFLSWTVPERNFKVLERNNWYDLWTKKVDYIEYQTSQFGKNFPLLRSVIYYYIGLAETAISLVLSISNDNFNLTIAHRRVSGKYKLQDLYNPLNFIIDSRIRDLSEYCKEKFYLSGIDIDKLKGLIQFYRFSNSEAVLFLARMLYPTYFFDCYQDIILGELDEIEINKYLVKAIEYQKFLKYIYFYLKQSYKIPEIEWIKKT